MTVGGLALTNNGGWLQSPNIRASSQLYTDGALTAASATISGALTAASATISGALSAGDTTVNGTLNVGGVTLQNSGGYVYTANSYWAAGSVVANNALLCGGTGGASWQLNSGNMYTPQSVLSNGNIIAQGALYCGGTGGPAWVDQGGLMVCSVTIQANVGIYCPDNSTSCGIAGHAWSQVASYWFNTVSARALKTSITPLKDDALAQVRALNPVSFRWRDGPDTKRLHSGFIADEVLAALGKSWGGYVKENGAEGIAYNELTAVLWRAVQTLAARVEALEAK
jgi:hypothetical protein